MFPSRLWFFIFSVVEDERAKMENLAGTGKARRKSDSAIIRRCPWCRNSASLIALKLICGAVNPESVQGFDVLTVLTLRIEVFVPRSIHPIPLLPLNTFVKPRDTGKRGASNLPPLILWWRKMQNSPRDRILTDCVTINGARLEDVLPTQARAFTVSAQKTDTSLEKTNRPGWIEVMSEISPKTGGNGVSGQFAELIGCLMMRYKSKRIS